MAIKWNDITQDAFVGDYNAYIRYANQLLRISGAVTETSINGMRVFRIRENTRYKVGMVMQNRFRLGCVPGLDDGITVTNIVIHPEDTNGTDNVGAYREMEITSEAGQTYLCVGAWATGAGDTIFNTLDSVTLFEVEDVPPAIVSIEVTTPPGKTLYKQGEEFSTAGMEVSAVYEDGRKEAVTEYAVSGFDGSMLGTQTVTVTYGEHTASFSVTVSENVISAACGYPTLANVQAVLDLFTGTLTFTGQGAVKSFSSSSWLWDISYRTMVKKVIFDERITASGSYTCYYCPELTEAVVPPSVTAINSYAFYYCSKLSAMSSLAHVQTIGTYAFYQCASLGGEVRLDSVTAINSYAFSYCNAMEKVWVGSVVTSIHSYAFRYSTGIPVIHVDREYQIISGYPWGATNASVTWATAPLESLALLTPPAKTEYRYGESFQKDGISVRLFYADGACRDITDVSQLSISGYAANVVGTQQVTISYRTVSCTAEVTVSNYLVGITVLSPPAKTTYEEGDSQDYSGLSVGLLYADGATEEIEDYTVSDIDREWLGTQAVTVTYGEYTASFSITGNFPTTLAKLLGVTSNMAALRNNSKNDDGTDTIDGVGWFSFGGLTAEKLYVSGNNWIGFGTSGEHLKVCRRDGAVWYTRRLEGRLTNGHRFLKLRVEGYTAYSQTADAYRLVYEVYLFDDNSIFLYLMQTPSNGSYLGVSELVCGTQTLPYMAGAYEKKPQMFSFYPQGDGGSDWTAENLPHSYLIHGIRFASPPARTVYRISEELDLGGMEILLDTDVAETIPITGYTVSGYDAFTADAQTVTLAYAAYSLSFEVTVTDGFAVRFLIYDNAAQQDVVLKEETVNYGQAAKPPETAERPGYVFTGWNGDYRRIIWDTDIYAEFIPKNVLAVNFCDYDGRLLKRQFVMRGSFALAPQPPVREGYVFSSWDKAFDYVTEDMTVTAVYAPRSDAFTVTFTDWSGAVLKTESVVYGGGASAPDVPKREGHYFLAWSRSFGYVTEDITVQAVYRRNRGTVAAEVYNGSRLVGEIRMAMDCTLSQKLNGECTLELTTLYQYGSFIQKRYRLELDGLIFDIANLEKKTQNGVGLLTVKGEHVSYILNDEEYGITEFYYKGTPAGCLAKLLSGTPFSVGTVDFTDTVELKVNRECTRRNALMQLVALCGGELEYDKYAIGIRSHIGRTEPIEIMETENVKNVGMSYSAAEHTETYSLELYRKLEIALGDEVHIVFTPLGIDKTKRIKGIDWNPFNFRKISVTVGGYRASLSDALYQVEETTDTTAEDLQALSDKVDGLSDSFDSLSGSLGGFNVMSVAELPANPDMNTIYLIQGTVEVN